MRKIPANMSAMVSFAAKPKETPTIPAPARRGEIFIPLIHNRIVITAKRAKMPMNCFTKKTKRSSRSLVVEAARCCNFLSIKNLQME